MSTWVKGIAPSASRSALIGAARLGGTDAGHELEKSEPRHLVPRIVGEAEGREQVLHVSGLEVPQTPVLDERDPSA